MLDSKLVKLEEMTGERWSETLQALKTRQRQLHEELNAHNSERLVMFNESKRLLKQLLERYQNSNGETRSTSQDESQ
jgi:hypothetical protein